MLQNNEAACEYTSVASSHQQRTRGPHGRDALRERWYTDMRGMGYQVRYGVSSKPPLN